jgi:hypothetical protein
MNPTDLGGAVGHRALPNRGRAGWSQPTVPVLFMRRIAV